MKFARCSIFLSAGKKKLHYSFTYQCAFNNKNIKEIVYFFYLSIGDFIHSNKFIFHSFIYIFVFFYFIHLFTHLLMHLLNKYFKFPPSAMHYSRCYEYLQ